MTSYIPEKGDFIITNLNPQSGHEQQGRRPALVISNRVFNQHTHLAIVCPLTNTDKKHPFHVSVEGNENVTGYIMVEQVKSIDYESRDARCIGQASTSLVEDVLAILEACF